jgi:YHS domain-containing protein
MLKCSKCPQQEQSLIKEQILLSPRIKHCQVCGNCMKEYSIAPSLYPEPTRFGNREYYFCSQKCSNNF